MKSITNDLYDLLDNYDVSNPLLFSVAKYSLDMRFFTIKALIEETYEGNVSYSQVYKEIQSIEEIVFDFYFGIKSTCIGELYESKKPLRPLYSENDQIYRITTDVEELKNLKKHLTEDTEWGVYRSTGHRVRRIRKQ